MPDLIDTPCHHCGGVFPAKKHQLKNNHYQAIPIYCSLDCRWAALAAGRPPPKRKRHRAGWRKPIEPDLRGEVWRQCVSLPEWRVSNMERVRGLRGWLLSTRGKTKEGYTILAGGVGQRRSISLHVLVCEAFHGPRPPGHEAAHLDGNSDHNTPDNLAWVTPLENNHHRRLHGTMPCGERAGNAKLTNEIVRAIRAEAASGEMQKVIAARYGIDTGHACRVINRRTWAHLD